MRGSIAREILFEFIGMDRRRCRYERGGWWERVELGKGYGGIRREEGERKGNGR